MKKLALSLFGALSMLLASGSAYAQAVHIRVDVPFQFSVQNKTLPAGEYEILSTGKNMPALQIRDSGRTLMYINAFDCQASQFSDETKLVFQRYGNSYFLSQVWTEGSRAGMELPQTASETREAENSAPKQVTLAAK